MDWEEKRREEIKDKYRANKLKFCKTQKDCDSCFYNKAGSCNEEFYLNIIADKDLLIDEVREFAIDCIKGYADIAAITARNHINKILQSKG